MAVVDADIVVYGSATMADDDTVLQIGGAIDTAKIVVFTGSISPPTTVEMLSSAADTRNVTITYLDAAGAKATETKALNGTTPVAFVATMAYILKAVIASGNANTVTIRKSGAGATLMTLGANVTEGRVLFYEAKANPSGGAAKTYFDKVFWKNTNGASDLTSAQISEVAEPGTLIDFGLEAALDGTGDNGAGNNRQVAPAGITFDSNAKNVATGTLTHAKAQGVWYRLSLPAGQAPIDSTYTYRLSGDT